MLIALVDLTLPPADRDALLITLEDPIRAARALPGNLSFRTLVDPAVPGALTLAQEWRDLAAFEAYRASAAFADLGTILRPRLTAPPVSRFGLEPVAAD